MIHRVVTYIDAQYPTLIDPAFLATVLGEKIVFESGDESFSENYVGTPQVSCRVSPKLNVNYDTQELIAESMDIVRLNPEEEDTVHIQFREVLMSMYTALYS